jgi:phosphonoacetaldehyde hydrolase
MLWRNLEVLGISAVNEVLKIGDTAADMQEGKNAGCLCVGVIKGSSMLGLSEEELATKSYTETFALLQDTEDRYRKAGADYVIEDITMLPELIQSINLQTRHKRREMYSSTRIKMRTKNYV